MTTMHRFETRTGEIHVSPNEIIMIRVDAPNISADMDTDTGMIRFLNPDHSTPERVTGAVAPAPSFHRK